MNKHIQDNIPTIMICVFLLGMLTMYFWSPPNCYYDYGKDYSDYLCRVVGYPYGYGEPDALRCRNESIDDPLKGYDVVNLWEECKNEGNN